MRVRRIMGRSWIHCTTNIHLFGSDAIAFHTRITGVVGKRSGAKASKVYVKIALAVVLSRESQCGRTGHSMKVELTSVAVCGKMSAQTFWNGFAWKVIR